MYIYNVLVGHLGFYKYCALPEWKRRTQSQKFLSRSVSYAELIIVSICNVAKLNGGQTLLSNYIN